MVHNEENKNTRNKDQLEHGRFEHPNGEVYIGTFKNGQREGQGIVHYSNNEYFKGTFTNGLRNGYGVYNSPGEVLAGNFENNLANGYCEFSYSNG